MSFHLQFHLKCLYLQIHKSKLKKHKKICKDQILLEPRTRMNLGSKSPNNKFVESGRKSQSESRENILVDSVKGKELHMHKYKKHHRLCPNSMINGLGFFLSFYYCLSSTSFLLFVFVSPPIFLPFSVIYHGFYVISIIHV